MRSDIKELLDALGNPKPPREITQGEYDENPDYFRQLFEYEGADSDPEVLGRYIHDTCWLDDELIQPNLLLFALPKCLQIWRRQVLELDSSGDWLVEQFCMALARHNGFVALLTDKHYVALAEFMRLVILDAIDQERSLSYSGNVGIPPYEWFQSLGAFAVTFPKLHELWSDWWSLKTPGQACGALQYVSCLMYPKDRNPVFAPWTHDRGGGPPCLWEVEGNSYDRPWHHENVAFLRRTLSTDYLRNAVQRCADKLQEGELAVIARRMVADFEECELRVTIRTEELTDILSNPEMYMEDWSA